MRRYVESQWYDRFTVFRLLFPLSYLYRFIIILRRKLQTHFSKTNNNIPIWVVGEITVGGSGKSPVVIYLADFMIKKGMKPVVLCSGYKGSLPKDTPGECFADSDYKVYGDEAVMISSAIKSPLVVAKERNKGIDFINNNIKDCNIIICDDGLQHYEMKRDVEIVVYNEKRIGNGHCFPAGPLREPQSRLKEADIVLDSVHDVKLVPKCMSSICSRKAAEFNEFPKRVHAVAAIGDPSKFFNVLRDLGFDIIEHPFPDHYAFKKEDLKFDDDLPVVMTTKDAVKCASFGYGNLWKLLFEVEASAAAVDKIVKML